MQLIDTLSHNIISHKWDTDEPITKAISKDRIQTLSSLTEQSRPSLVATRPSGHKKGFLGPEGQVENSAHCWTRDVGELSYGTGL